MEDDFDEEGREADLRLDHFEGANADLGGYRAVVPGDPGESELISRIESDEPDELMPPADTGHTLSAAEKQLLRKWVTEGGAYA